MEFIPFMIKMLWMTVAFCLLLAPSGAAREEIAGPVEAEIIRIVDGDTLLVEAQPWPQQKMEVFVRIRGIDAPELKSKCAGDRKAGHDAQLALEAVAMSSRTIRLTRISGDKYFGRIVADVILPDGHSVADNLLLAGLARPYDGGRKPPDTCSGG